MTRTEDQITGGLHRLADRVTPSSDAWEKVRRRIADREPNHEMEIIMLTDNTITKKRWPLVTAAAAVVTLGVGGVVLVTTRDDAAGPAANPDVTEPVPEDSPAAEAAALPLAGEGAAIEPGRYQSDLLGVPVDFTLPEAASGSWELRRAAPGHIAFVVPEGDFAEFVQMYRVSSWYDTDEAFDAFNLSGSLDALDIDGYIDAHGIVVEASGTTTVGGRPAQYRLLTVPEDPAGEPTLCVANMAPPCLIGAGPEPVPERGPLPTGFFVFGSGRPPAMWLVELDGFAPLLIQGATSVSDADQWRQDVLVPLVESIALGAPGPAAG